MMKATTTPRPSELAEVLADLAMAAQKAADYLQSADCPDDRAMGNQLAEKLAEVRAVLTWL